MTIENETIARIRARVREIATTIVADHADVDDREARWSAAGMRALADAGLGGLTVPRSEGGEGLGLEALAVACEELGRENASAAISFGMHCVGAAVIAAKATPDHRERYLRPIAEGRHFTTLALSEPGTGSHFWIPETRTLPENGKLALQGTKSFVTSGGHADSYVLSVVGMDDEAGEGTFSCLVLDAETEGMQWGEEWAGFGMRANSSRTLELDDVKVPRENLLGEPGDQLWYTFEVVAPYFLTAMAGTYLGVATAAVEIAREHLGTRRHSESGELLGNEPVVGMRLGEMWLDVERTRQLIYSGCARGDRGDPAALHSILGGKAAAAETSVRIANDAMTLCGGRGYGEHGRLGRLLRDARASHVMAPTTDILKVWIGRALLNLPLL